MRVWATRDRSRLRALWSGKRPKYYKADADWGGSNLLFNDEDCEDGVAILDALFPRNIKPGECKMFHIPRLGTKGK